MVELVKQFLQLENEISLVEVLKCRSFGPSFAPAGMSLEDWLSWAEGWIRKGDPLEWGIKASFEEIGRVTIWSHRE